MVLHEVLTRVPHEVMRRWKEQVRGTLAPESMAPMELIDHLPQFLGEIRAALQKDAGIDTAVASPEESPAAAEHGEQRLRLGFSLESLVREYGALLDAILGTARHEGVEVGPREMQVVVDCTIVGIAHAVSEYARQRDAELLRQANEHFAFVAHELRDPLSAASTAFAQLRSKGHLPETGNAVGALERGLRRTSELIEQTLQATRAASGIELRRQWTTLRAVIEDAELGATPEAEAKGVDLRVLPVGDERINLDLRLIRSAVSNLLRNAVKYTEPGGAVELRGSLTNGRLVIEIEDCCGGLEPGRVEEAFAPFVRLDERQSGFGLGLAIAKQAVDAHEGSIRVQNLPGKGCVFVLELPLAEGATRGPS